MVRYYDADAVFETSLDGVWSLIEAHTDEDTPRIHPDMVSMRTLQETDTTSEREVTRTTPEGRKETSRMRFTADPPRSLTIEYLDGPMAGSWITNAYVPEGKRTRVIVTADVRGEGIEDDAALDAARQLLNARFEEDAAYLKQLKQAGKIPAS